MIHFITFFHYFHGMKFEKKNIFHSNLASIHAFNEQGFIEANLGQSTQPDGRTWIGMRDYGSNGEFEWSDDSNRFFTNWAPGEPNNQIGGEQTCVEVYTDRDFQYIFIIQITFYFLPRKNSMPSKINILSSEDLTIFPSVGVAKCLNLREILKLFFRKI